MICGGSFAVWDSDRYKFVYVTGAEGVTEEYAVCPRCLHTEAYKELRRWAEEKELRERKRQGEMIRRGREMMKESQEMVRFWYVVCFWVVLIGLILLSFLLE